jgi:hypothetical protein
LLSAQLAALDTSLSLLLPLEPLLAALHALVAALPAPAQLFALDVPLAKRWLELFVLPALLVTPLAIAPLAQVPLLANIGELLPALLAPLDAPLALAPLPALHAFLLTI